MKVYDIFIHINIIYSGRIIVLNRHMDSNQLISQGNQFRTEVKPLDALACYGQALIIDPDSASAFNNYGNTLRELGQPVRSIPFLQHSCLLDPSSTVAQFNLAVAYLLSGDYARGFPAYEARWNFEHLAGTLPKYTQPRWTGQDLKDKTIFVIGEQGHGDMIQFSRFLINLHERGATIHLQVTEGLVPLFQNSLILKKVTVFQEPDFDFDYWIPIMSIPAVLGITLENLPHTIQYLNARNDLAEQWRQRLGLKRRLRVGFGWSGRKDSWINQHKSMPFETMLGLIKSCPDYEWINLQVDVAPEEEAQLAELGLSTYPGSIRSWADTAALISHLDVFVGVDTAVSHMSAALGRPTWIMLSQYALDWRWLLNRDDSPWYGSAKLFRQPSIGDWASVTKQIKQYLSWFKV